MAIFSFYPRFPLQKPSMAGYYSDRMLQLSGQPLSLHEIAAIADASVRVQIPPAAVAQMEASREGVRRVPEDNVPVYGINPGLGKLCEVRISNGDLARLQLNLVRS